MTGPGRVLLTTDAVGGVWSYAIDLARVLSDRGAAVELAVLGPSATPGQRAAAMAIAGVTLHDTGLALDWMAEDASTLDAVSAALATLARQHDVDLVQLHTPALRGQQPWPVPVLAVAHSCVGTWWSAVRAGPMPADFAWRMEAMRRGLINADAVVAPTRAFADALGSVYAVPREIGVVHNGRRGAAASSGGRYGIITAGRLWDEGKNLALLDRVGAGLDVPIRAAGALQGPNGTAVTLRNVESLGVLDVASMAAAMACARIFASPALYEPFGLAVLEAAQIGLPLVLSDIPTFRELWDGAAIFVPPQDDAAWTSVLRRLHAYPAQCVAWGMRAQKRAADYDMERFGRAMWDRHCRLTTAPARASAA